MSAALLYHMRHLPLKSKGCQKYYKTARMLRILGSLASVLNGCHLHQNSYQGILVSPRTSFSWCSWRHYHLSSHLASCLFVFQPPHLIQKTKMMIRLDSQTLMTTCSSLARCSYCFSTMIPS